MCVYLFAAKRPDRLCTGPESVVKELVYEVREAKQDDWWQVAEVHCRSFYPKATCLLGILLRFDRVETLKVGPVLCPYCHGI